MGRIVYVERDDPDGDGDAYFVIRDRQGITLPGDRIHVRAGLLPHPLPGPGDLISAAGPVQYRLVWTGIVRSMRLNSTSGDSLAP